MGRTSAALLALATLACGKIVGATPFDAGDSTDGSPVPPMGGPVAATPPPACKAQPCVREVAAGDGFTCTRNDDGAVYCWGIADQGIVGDGTTVTAAGVSISKPKTKVSIKRVVHIYAGGRHACALLDDGSASCWGANPNGELGAGLNDGYSAMPLMVQASATIQSLALGSAHSCAIVAGGGVQCWGDEEHGQLGNGISGAGLHSTTPVTVSAVGSLVATAIALGKDHTCALFTNHSVWCWGRNDKAQLGDGSTNDSTTPVQVVNAPTDLTRLAAGDEFTCGWSPGGAVWCWGALDHGELADTASGNLVSATNIPALGGATLLAVGSDFGCATLGAGTLLECWGANDHTQLGQGGVADMTGHPTPNPNVTPFVTPDTFDASHVESSHACVVKDGAISCWGENGHGELGDGTMTDRATPAPVLWQ